MKKALLFPILALLFPAISYAQIVEKTFTFNENANELAAEGFVKIKNVNGDVNVTGYDGDNIEITAVRSLKKRRGRLSEAEAEEYQLVTKWHEGSLFVYVEAPGFHAEFYRGGVEYHMHQDGDNPINFNFDIEVKMPRNVPLTLSTINRGDVTATHFEKGVEANNVNGSIELREVAGPTSANTVNGDIEVWFAKNPTTDTSFNTVNGIIEVYSPKNFGAVVTFESVHGELYTNFDKVTRLPNQLNKEEDRQGHRYRISSNAPIQIGDGGPMMSFKMVNGSAYIKERES